MNTKQASASWLKLNPLQQPLQTSQDDLDKIHALTRREFSQEELFIFRVVLCDNDIDRDFERFDLASLQSLANLFIGTTGICDHDPLSVNQQARIYDAYLVSPPDTLTSDSIPYVYLEAKAYMVRTKSNEDLILEIDAGIKKEVSVGCNVKSAVCSICGKDRNVSPCNHSAGELYDGQLCFFTLQNPMDAYEWSFVAVPAQKNAGIIKLFDSDQNSFENLSPQLTDYIAKLKADASSARRDASRNLISLVAKYDPNNEFISKSLQNLSIDQIKAWTKLLSKALEQKQPLHSPQIQTNLPPIPHLNEGFFI